MSEAAGTRTVSVEDFAATIAGVAGIPAARVRPEAGLLADLGLDSLTLTEVVVVLVDAYRMDSLADDLDERDWNHMTVRDLYDEYLSGRPMRRLRRGQ